MIFKLFESVKKCSFGLHLSILIAEILVLVLIMTVLKNDRANFNQNNGIYKLMRQKRSMLRYKRFLQESRFSGLAPYTSLPRNSTPCRDLHHYWRSVCPTNTDPNAHVSQRDEHSFIQDTLQHFAAYSHTRMVRSSDFPLGSGINEPENENSTNGTDIGIARLWHENLTAAEKCRREGLEGSLSCVFEYEHPRKAVKVYEALRPLLVMETSRESVIDDVANDDISSLNTEIFEPLHEDLDENRATRRKRRSIISRKSNAKSRTKRNTQTNNSEFEICRTSHVMETLRSPIHARTNRQVSLYTFRGANYTQEIHYQSFHVGSCVSTKPNYIARDDSLFCKEASNKILAYIFISNSDAATGNFRRCYRIIDTIYVVCRDYIVVHTHCKLYFKATSTVLPNSRA